MRVLFGASLLAGAASLPLHLMPLLVMAVAADGLLLPAQAGWIASAYMFGQVAAAVSLPACGFLRLGRLQALWAVAMLIGVVALSGQLSSAGLVATWLVIGLASGALQFLATTTAAASDNPAVGFRVRLGVSLLVAAVAVGFNRLASGFTEYGILAIQLVLILGLLSAAGMVLYRGVSASQESRNPAQGRFPSHASGLAVVFILFAGQIGFWSYAVLITRQNGLPIERVVEAIALCKAIAGLKLLAEIRTKRSGGRSLGAPGVWVVAGIALIAGAKNSWLFSAGLLCWELGLNTLSARLQARVVETSPESAGSWLAGALLFGAGVGPLALALESHMRGLFWAFACFSALVPWMWGRSLKQRAT